jgi:hypothetical protein
LGDFETFAQLIVADIDGALAADMLWITRKRGLLCISILPQFCRRCGVVTVTVYYHREKLA